MKSYREILVGCAVAALAASAEIVSFPGCPWTETKVLSDGGHVRVVDKAGRQLLSFNTEGGNFGKYLVVSQAVDRLDIDARAAFKAGMRKLVFTSATFDPKPYRGQDCTLLTEMGGARGSKGLAYFEGHAPGLHYYRSRAFETKGHRKTYPFVAAVAEKVETLHLRWDVSTAAAKGPVAFYGAKYATEKELPVRTERQNFVPELIFHAPFEDSAEAVRAKGEKAPRQAKGLAYAEGKFGKAVRITAKTQSVLEYGAKGNLVPERGTVSLWFKREWPDQGLRADKNEIWRVLFANPSPKGERIGSGQLWFWWWGNRFRADQSDDDDSYSVWQGPVADEWNHLAVSWDEVGVKIYLNGKYGSGQSDGASPMASALKAKDLLTFNRQVFETFCVGSEGKQHQFDGLVDDLRIYSAPLSDAQIREIWRRGSVIEITARGCYSLADTPGTLTVSATSPSGCDLSWLKYCICDKAGRVLARYRNPVGSQAANLVVNLPAGEYELKATDGDWFYGSVPYVVLRKDNPHVLKPDNGAEKMLRAAPGVPENLELVQALKLDHTPGPDRFRAVGPVTVKRLGEVPYLEAGPKAGDRYALRFNIDTNTPLWVFEVDYPDDTLRTADFIIQKSKIPQGDYTMQVGVATGDEYPNTGRILTHRVLYWASDPDVALIVMTARTGAPAAISAVRVYRVKDGALPVAEINEPKPLPPPTGIARAWHDFKVFDEKNLEERQKRMKREAEIAGWNRMVALYFEDPAIGYDFAVPKSSGFLPADLDNLIDRTVALMKFTGENLFAYPGAWYHGLIGEQYNPRHHAPDFLSAWYAKFDHEGLFLMPTVNPNTMPIPEGLVTRRSMSDGTLHDSVIAIHDTGKPNWGGWHDTPPNFNFHHPKVRKHISGIIDALADQGAGHASFKGVCMHLTRHCFLWFGDEESGYNDYTVEAFAKARKINLPTELKTGALRGKAYAEWLRAHAWQEWLQWRCDVVTDFYVKEARKLAERRPDLKLWLNYMVPANIRHPDFLKDDFMTSAWRGAGLDPVRLTKEAPNVILGQTMVPADYRWRHEGNYPSPAARAHQRVLDTLPGFYANLKGATYPLVHQHDRYWESPIGDARKGGANSLSCDWLNECAWRVSTINPSGVHALRHFVEPLRYGDVLGLSKGGFLIGTYGMEPYLVPFFQAFRALPAVVMTDVPCPGNVRVRQCTFNKRTYFYVVNTDAKPATISLEFPAKTQDLVTGEYFLGGIFGNQATRQTLNLAPYEMRSYVAPEGMPTVLSVGTEVSQKERN